MVVLVLLLLVASAVGASAKPSGPEGRVMDRCATEQIVRWERMGDVIGAQGWPPEGGPLVPATPFHVDMVDAEDLDVDGAGVYVAVLDTGLVPEWPTVLPYADVATDLGMGFSHDVTWDSGLGDFVWGPLRSDRGYLTNEWGSGHGTHVTSTITGYYLPGYFGPEYWVRGVAPGVTIIPVLVLDTWFLDCPDPDYYNAEWDTACHDGKVVFGGGTWEMVAAGIYYAADLAHTLDGPLVISMSLGGPEPYEPLRAAIDYAIDQGCIVVASAGNEGMFGMGWPGAYPEVISAGATGWTEQWTDGFWFGDVPEKLNTKDVYGNNWQMYLEDFSSRPVKSLGQKQYYLDVVDPGASILGRFKAEVFWTGTEWLNWPTDWYFVWGTSMSAPHVSGIAALVLEVHPFINQGMMEAILTRAASRLPLASDGAWVFDPWYGFYHYTWYGTDWGSGLLQADEALEVARHF